MPELAEIFRSAADGYCERHAGRLTPSQRRALDDIPRCRTPALGGSVYACDDCGSLDYAYHSCRNRHCPKCQHDRANLWLQATCKRLLPCDHYLLTFTLPEPLRAVARAQPVAVYSALLRAAAGAVQTLAADRRWIGGTPGILAVLHTWSRTLEHHPHVHLLVTAGALSSDDQAWIKPAHPRFLMPGYMLSDLFRAKFRGQLTRADVMAPVKPCVWTRRWTVHVQQIGRGDHAAFYLSRYIYSVALSNDRIERFAEGRVTFRYTHARTRETRRQTLPADTFISRFLQHVLPRGFTKVRSYGLLSPGARPRLERARHLLLSHAPAPPAPAAPATAATQTSGAADPGTPPTDRPRRCPCCKRGALRLVRSIPRSRAPP